MVFGTYWAGNFAKTLPRKNAEAKRAKTHGKPHESDKRDPTQNPFTVPTRAPSHRNCKKCLNFLSPQKLRYKPNEALRELVQRHVASETRRRFPNCRCLWERHHTRRERPWPITDTWQQRLKSGNLQTRAYCMHDKRRNTSPNQLLRQLMQKRFD